MAISAPSPSSSTSDSSFQTDEYPNDLPMLDLGLDPSDPLNLLLHNTSQTTQDSTQDISSQHGIPPDWSDFSILWPTPDRSSRENVKYPEMPIEFSPLDLDYNPSMAVDPSALHLESTYPQPPFYSPTGTLSNELLTASFPFTFGSHEFCGPYGDKKTRRLSMTSSSSSSGASLSPVIEPLNTTVPFVGNPSDELAQRVRQSVGVMLAVPTGLSGRQNPLTIHPQTQAKLPIPRLPRSKVATKAKRIPPPKSESSSTASTPPPSDSHTGSPMSSPPSEPVAQTAGQTVGRPKTNHTTIERRYRTNLNARIQSLRQAVPALRVLEEKDKQRKGGDVDVMDIVDDRGFVDGVKVARKCSKANVLGKAVEYIRVLKKREKRLTREQSGLKSLICGLVGGAALLEEWEREWKEKFGGQETDEVEGEEAEPLSDDDEGDDEDADEGLTEAPDGRARKRAKIIKAPKDRRPAIPATIQAALDMTAGHTSSTISVVPEKRKRGRPRKVITTVPEEISMSVGTQSDFTSSVMVSEEHNIVRPATAQNIGQAPQYLLATFALFSFFNSPLSYSSSPSAHPHTHSGTVLGHTHTQAVPNTVEVSYGWREIIQAFHFLVSVLVFLSIILPWLPVTLKGDRLLSFFPSLFRSIFSTLKHNTTRPTPTSTSVKPHITKTTSTLGPPTLMDALNESNRGALEEADHLRCALAVSAGLGGLLQVAFGRKDRTGLGSERKRLEQRAWVRLGELAVLDQTVSFASRVQTYWCMSSHLSSTSSTSDLSTLALIIQPLSQSKATALWSQARKAQLVRPYEKLALESVNVDEAAERLATRSSVYLDERRHGPIAVLASMLVLERLKRHTAALFIKTVLSGQPAGKGESDWNEDVELEDLKEEEEKNVTIDAAKSLGGRTGELGEMLERVWKTSVCTLEDIGYGSDCGGNEEVGEDGDSLDEDIVSLLTALTLYRRIFPTSVLPCTTSGAGAVSILLSPPPSPSRKSSELHLALRRRLGARVFDFTDGSAAGGGRDGNGKDVVSLGVALEDARDRVVDMLVSVERQVRGG